MHFTEKYTSTKSKWCTCVRSVTSAYETLKKSRLVGLPLALLMVSELFINALQTNNKVFSTIMALRMVLLVGPPLDSHDICNTHSCPPQDKY